VDQYRDPTTAFSMMRGIFPGDVIQHAATRKLSAADRSDAIASNYNPQLHPLHYEWYFTYDTALEISREFVSAQGLTICLGAPMIASAAIKRGKDVIFIDQNPRVLARFPELMRASEIHVMDATEAKRLSIKADSLIFDSPWYPGDCLAWLVVASHLVKSGGTIIFGLYPPLVRPTAQLERDLILDIASSIGQVDVKENALPYQTPLFELDALRACGLAQIGDWRRGDLVTIRDKKPLEVSLPRIPRRADIDGTWTSFVIESQVVKLRTNLKRQSDIRQDALLGEIDGNFVLPSVSVRDNRRDAVHVWTSRNRVASVSNTSTVFDILRRLEAGICLSDAVQLYHHRFGKNLEHQIQTLLLLES